MAKPATIGVVMDFFRPGVLEGAGAYARQHGLRLDARWSVRGDWMPDQPGWDGVLAQFADMESAYRRVQALHLPTVHLAGWLGERALPRVEHDFAACASMAAEEFARMGITRVAAVNVRRHSINFRSLRGFRVAARRLGLICELLSAPTVKDLGGQVRHLAAEVTHLTLPCGLFLVNAGQAWSLIDELDALKIRVPEDVRVIVIDKDTQRTSELAPTPLTAVTLDDWRQGFEAAAMLHQLLRGEAPGQTIRRLAPAGIVRRESTGYTTNRDPLVARALHIIRDTRVHLPVEELAARLSVSRRTLEQRFRLVTGATVHAMMLGKRLEVARRLLSVGRPVADVAEECGFASVHYFTTAFKRLTGVTPGRFQRQSAVPGRFPGKENQSAQNRKSNS